MRQADCEPPLVLIVDDVAENREILVRRIERMGHRTAVAVNGEDALTSMRETQPDLILLDIMMPIVDGFGVLESMYGDQKLRDIPTIVISAASDLDNIVRALELGAIDYMPKPFNFRILRSRIDSCLERKKLRDEQRMYIEEIETQKQRADQLLHALFPDSVVQELKEHGQVEPLERNGVAVMFADIVGFTEFCRNHTSREVHSKLQHLVRAFEGIAQDFRLEQIKTIGDCFMAVAGLSGTK